MSRLTRRDEYGDVLPQFGCTLADAVEKLADYEDLEEQGRLIETIRCKDCKHFTLDSDNEDLGYCKYWDNYNSRLGYCSGAKMGEVEE